MSNYLDQTGLSYFWQKIKTLINGKLGTTETAHKTASIPMGQVDGTSTSTVFTATVDGITELRDGVCVWLKNGVVTSASGFTININGLGAKPVYSSLAAASRSTTIFNSGYTMLFVYNSTRVSGGCWDCVYGYDSNTNTIGYQVRHNSGTGKVSGATYRYRLLFTADEDTLVPANTSTSTNATATRTVNQTPIDPFGAIYYYGGTGAVSAGGTIGAASLWQQYAIALGYSFNRTGAALTLSFPKAVYVKAAPTSDGKAIIDADTPYVQDLPTTADGKIYIYLGQAYSATNIELDLHHPVYEFADGKIRPYTGHVGVPSGGLSGQVLVKSSNADYNAIWSSDLQNVKEKITGLLPNQTYFDAKHVLVSAGGVSDTLPYGAAQWKEAPWSEIVSRVLSAQEAAPFFGIVEQLKPAADANGSAALGVPYDGSAMVTNITEDLSNNKVVYYVLQTSNGGVMSVFKSATDTCFTFEYTDIGTSNIYTINITVSATMIIIKVDSCAFAVMGS